MQTAAPLYSQDTSGELKGQVGKVDFFGVKLFGCIHNKSYANFINLTDPAAHNCCSISFSWHSSNKRHRCFLPTIELAGFWVLQSCRGCMSSVSSVPQSRLLLQVERCPASRPNNWWWRFQHHKLFARYTTSPECRGWCLTWPSVNLRIATDFKTSCCFCCKHGLTKLKSSYLPQQRKSFGFRNDRTFQNDFYFKHQVQICISSQKKEEVPPPGGRTLRPRHGLTTSYIEDTSEEDYDEDEEEEEARPKPIASRYLRGPPIGPRPPTKQVWHHHPPDQ